MNDDCEEDPNKGSCNELDEETEILPHIKAAKDFEIYEPVTLQPFFTILPWDENTKPNYEVFFKVKK